MAFFFFFFGGNRESNIGNCGCFLGGIGNYESLRTRIIVGAFCLFLLLVEITNLLLVIVFFFWIGNRESNIGNCGCFFWMGNCESLYSRVIVDGFSFFKMVNANLMLLIDGGFTFLGGNRKSLNTLLLITYIFFK